MIFVDANVFLAYDNINDLHHTKSVALWQEIEAGKFGEYITSDYVLNEVVGVTLRKLGKARAIKLGEQMLKSVFVINIDDHMLAEAWNVFSKTRLGLNLVDCTNLIAIKIANAEFIATLDKEFYKVVGLKVIS